MEVHVLDTVSVITAEVNDTWFTTWNYCVRKLMYQRSDDNGNMQESK